MAKQYTIEVVKEDRALVTVTAENITAAYEDIRKQVTEGTVEWAMKDNLTFEVINTKEVKA